MINKPPVDMPSILAEVDGLNLQNTKFGELVQARLVGSLVAAQVAHQGRADGGVSNQALVASSQVVATPLI